MSVDWLTTDQLEPFLSGDRLQLEWLAVGSPARRIPRVFREVCSARNTRTFEKSNGARRFETADYSQAESMVWRILMMKHRFACILLLISLVIGGCSQSSADRGDIPAECRAETLEQLFDETIGMFESGDVQNPDVLNYASDMGIDIEQAAFRLSLQEPIGTLNACLSGWEEDTFSGLWVEHEPDYQVLVAFTQDGKEILMPYIAGTTLEGVLEARQASLTIEELRALQAEAGSLLKPLNMPVSTAINIPENVVEIFITDPDAFYAALQAHNIQLPPPLKIVPIYDPLGNELPFEVNPDDSIFFPQLKMRSTSFMEALLIGRLEVKDGCLVVYQEGNDDRITVVWQTDYFLHNNLGQIEMLNREGKVVAHVGEMIYLGGGNVGQVNSDQLLKPIPDHCASTPLWLMGEFLPEEFIPNVTGGPEE